MITEFVFTRKMDALRARRYVVKIRRAGEGSVRDALAGGRITETYGDGDRWKFQVHNVDKGIASLLAILIASDLGVGVEVRFG